MPHVNTTIRPDLVLDVDDAQLAELASLGLVHAVVDGPNPEATGGEHSATGGDGSVSPAGLAGSAPTGGTATTTQGGA